MKKHIGVFVCLIVFVFANDRPGQTGISIHCDTPNILIYVDGDEIGRSPVKDVVAVIPGWHRVGVFPDLTEPMLEDVPSTRKMQDLFRMGQQDVLVEEGKIVRVTVGYRLIEGEVNEYQKRISSSRWIGFSMVIFVVFFLTWIA